MHAKRRHHCCDVTVLPSSNWAFPSKQGYLTQFASELRFRAVCACGFVTKWRKYSPALEEDRHEHLRAAEAAGQSVDWGFRAKPIS